MHLGVGGGCEGIGTGGLGARRGGPSPHWSCFCADGLGCPAAIKLDPMVLRSLLDKALSGRLVCVSGEHKVSGMTQEG